MIDPKYIVDLKGKKFVLWAGLLDAATNAGLKSIEVTLLQFPAPENGHLAISQATVTFEDGRLFVEIGDAGPQNCGTMIAPHACRMSATRAKGRALRDALNIGETMFEELGPDADSPSTHHNAERGASRPVQRAKHDPEDEAAQKGVCSVCGVDVAPAVAQAALKKFSKVVCIEHGREIVDAMRAVAEEAIVGADG